MNWREKMPPAMTRMFSIFHQDVFYGHPSLADLADRALAHVKDEERESVRDFVTGLLASGVTRGELRTLMKKAGVRDVALTDPLPLFELIRDKLNEPEEAATKRQRAAMIATVREILRRDWDPIGIDMLLAAARQTLDLDLDPASADDEYDSYVGGVVKLIEEKASPDKIARHLRTVAETEMSVASDEARTWAAAEKLAALADE
jgi:hypothetical protein